MVHPCVLPFNRSNSTNLVAVVSEKQRRVVGEKKTETERNAGKSKSLTGIEPHTEQCLHSEKDVYLIKTGNRSTV